MPINYLIWLDLEMTGLEVAQDRILEAAAVVTDAQLNIIAQTESLVIHQEQHILDTMNDWCKRQHGLSGLTAAVQQSPYSHEQVEEMLVTFLKPYIIPGKGILCGNSVWQDKFFLQVHMPRVHQLFHYRIVDVTSIKELLFRWYPQSPHKEFKKSDTHRALSDTLEAIQELRHYRTYFFMPVPV